MGLARNSGARTVSRSYEPNGRSEFAHRDFCCESWIIQPKVIFSATACEQKKALERAIQRLARKISRDKDSLAERSQFELSGDFARVRKQPNLVGLWRFRTQHREELLQCTPTPRRRQNNLVRGQFRGTNEQSRAPAGLATCRESSNVCVIGAVRISAPKEDHTWALRPI